uniref:Uncharacterized protein n=1 Tax=Caulobacter sp. (strain K31) TaxID=366602 RepID=B0SXZ6_CAUSK
MIERTAVYVGLVGEGTDVWRPTSAYRLTETVYVLSNENFDADTETWAVAPGSLVTVTNQQTRTGLIPVAVIHAER